MAATQSATGTTASLETFSSSGMAHNPQQSLSESVRVLRQSASTSDPRPSTPTNIISPLQTPINSPRLDRHAISPIDSTGSPSYRPLLRAQKSTPQFSRSGLQYSPSNQDIGRSPRDRLNAFLSSSPQKSGLRSLPTPVQSEAQSDCQNSQAEPQLHSTWRQRSNSTLAQAATKPPSPSPLPKSSILTSITSAALPRNPSQESVKSTLSSNASASPLSTQTSQSHLSSRGPGLFSLEDISTLVASAGSAEAAIYKLLQEKHALTVRNDQLWKLAENQRNMVLDLSKDLQQALKDKEQYRQRFNNHLSLEAAAVLMEARAETPTNIDRQRSRSPRNYDREVSHSSTQGVATKGAFSSNRSLDHSVASSMRELGFPTPPRTTHHEQDEGPDGYSAIPSQVRPVGLHGDTSVTTTEKSRLRSISSPLAAVSLPINLSGQSSEKQRKAAPGALYILPVGLQYGQPEADGRDESGSDYDDSSRQDGDEVGPRGRRTTHTDGGEYGQQPSKVYQFEENRIAPRPLIAPRSISDTVVGVATQRASNKRILPAGLTGGIGLPGSPRALLVGGLQSPLPSSLGSMALNLGSVAPTPAHTYASLRLSNQSGPPLSPRLHDRPMDLPVSRTPSNLVTPVVSSQQHRPNLSSSYPSLRSIRNPSNVGLQTELHKTPSMSLSTTQALIASIGDKPTLTSTQSSYEGQVFKGFCLDGYPDLVLPPNALPFVYVKVHTARLIPSRQSSAKGKSSVDEPIIQLAVHARTDGKQLWRVEKGLTAISLLDLLFKSKASFDVPVPEKSLFNGHSPIKLDARRTALDLYFMTMLETPMDERAALVLSDFLSKDVVGPALSYPHRPSKATSLDSPSIKPDFRKRKEGYLGKKGKHIGGWKQRYFVLDFSELRYFEAPGAEASGIIKLHGATLSRQNANEIEAGDDFRHGFMIAYQGDRHILCCETDEERDAWVDTLLAHTDAPIEERSTFSHGSYRPSPELTKASGSELRAISYEHTVMAGTPAAVDTPAAKLSNISPPLSNDEFPVTTGILQPSGSIALNSKSLKDSKKRSIFGFRTKATEDTSVATIRPALRSSPSQRSTSGRQTPTRAAVFGVPLLEAVRNAPIKNIDICLPAPVYRCIEYLEKNAASNEEGIFRLSGSSRVIKDLKERFNTEGDVKLLDGEPYDIHAVASVLKLFLRELPVSVLTRELHLDFLRVLETPDEHQRIQAINVLIHKLPEVNFELLVTLSRFLIHVVSNAEVNKMTVRNVGIVFAPTLNIPGTLIHLFLENFDSIFGRPLSATSFPVIQRLTTLPESDIASNEIRSPRKQMFSEVTTPGPYQTTFNQVVAPPLQRTGTGPTAFVPLQTQYEDEQQQQQQYRAQSAPIPDVANVNGYSSLNAAFTNSPNGSLRKSSSTMRKLRPDSSGKTSEGGSSPPPPDGKKKGGMARLRELAS